MCLRLPSRTQVRRDNRPLILRREGSRFFVMLIGAIETSDKIEGVGEERPSFLRMAVQIMVEILGEIGREIIGYPDEL